jgi:hypothetical protein
MLGSLAAVSGDPLLNLVSKVDVMTQCVLSNRIYGVFFTQRRTEKFHPLVGVLFLNRCLGSTDSGLHVIDFQFRTLI